MCDHKSQIIYAGSHSQNQSILLQGLRPAHTVTHSTVQYLATNPFLYTARPHTSSDSAHASVIHAVPTSTSWTEGGINPILPSHLLLLLLLLLSLALGIHAVPRAGRKGGSSGGASEARGRLRDGGALAGAQVQRQLDMDDVRKARLRKESGW